MAKVKVDTKLQEIVKIIEDGIVKNNIETEKVSEINYIGRGFSSLEDAKAFVDSNYFKGLGKADRDEYLNWLNS